MWWYLPMVLHCGSAAFATAWGCTAYWLAARTHWLHLHPDSPAPPPDVLASHHGGAGGAGGSPAAAAASAAALGVLAGCSAALLLGFLSSLLANIAEGLFLCCAHDRDSGAVTWRELHRLCAELPCCAEAREAAAGTAGLGMLDSSVHNVSLHGGLGVGGGISYGYAVPPLASSQQQQYVPYGYQVVPAPQPLPPLPYGASQLQHHHHLHQYPAHAAAPGGAAATFSTPHAQLGQPVGGYSSQQRGQPQQQGYGAGGGFWGWLRSPRSSLGGGGLYGMPVGAGRAGDRYRNDRPQYPPPAVLSPPYSEQRYPIRPAPPPPPQPTTFMPFFGSPSRHG
ncbi:hypothetical protein Agub_g3029 [Astrephomene gubernaculifera]|uniref:Uncharacterized protein n=1 Tax=Astrephomene gubernaculifera TaxID=47775 RepID=A0AAD3DIX0_9CHLO|nr:hypothetical protein Agub_g3029 [Astrephomene gubernaculifera]